MAYINKVWRGPANGPFMSALVHEALASGTLRPGTLVELGTNGLFQAPLNFSPADGGKLYVVNNHHASNPEGATPLINQAHLDDTLVEGFHIRSGEMFGLVVQPGTPIEAGQNYTVDPNGYATPALAGEVALFTPKETVATDGTNAQFAEFIAL